MVLKQVWIFLLAVGLSCVVPGSGAAHEDENLYGEIDNIMHQKLAVLMEFVEQEEIIKLVRLSNHKHWELPLAEILLLDEEWTQSEKLNELMQAVMTNTCAQVLVRFQDKHDEFAELFISDAKGLVVGETNRTSDYYQADEEWWLQAYDEGKGWVHYGEIEYDESAQVEGISLYIPVMDLETGRAIGVLKAVCDLTAIMMEL